MRKPNFLVIGAQKAGTTYLCSLLAKHPDVFFSDPKELLFFQKDMLDQSAFNTYLDDYFSEVKGEKWVGEGSTIYFQWPRAIKNIRKFLGLDLKIIVCLRHPVEKAISYYIHNWRKGRITGNESILDVGAGSITLSPYETSKYAEHIKKWLKVYKREQVKFLLFDTLVSSNQKFVTQATDFLGIPEVTSIHSVKINAGFPVDLAERYLVVKATPSIGQVVPKIAIADLEELQEMLVPDISLTEELIHTKLTAWKGFRW